MIDGGCEKYRLDFHTLKFVLKFVFPQHYSTPSPFTYAQHFLQSYILIFLSFASSIVRARKEAVLNVMIGRFKEILFL